MTNTRFASALGAALFLATGPARAADVHLELGAEAAGSSWRGDAAGYGSFELAFRFRGLVGPYGELAVGYGAVDQRMLTLFGIGVALWLPPVWRLRPRLGLGFVHQHEEAMSVVAHEYLQAMVGMGDGIRHRSGGELVLGADVELVRRKSFTLYTTVGGGARLFPDPMGPLVYGVGGVALGGSFDFGGGA